MKEFVIESPDRSEEEKLEESAANNSEAISIARKINSFSIEELRSQFSTEQLLTALDSLPVSFGDQTIPQEILDAESRIYSTYEPSEVLQKIHKDVNLSSIGTYSPRELFLLKEEWKTRIDIEKKVSFIKSYVEKLTKEYGFNQDVPVALYDKSFNEESAMWMPTHELDKIGVLILYKSSLENDDLPTVLSNISHEIAHGYQEFIQKEIYDVPEDLQNDQKWFRAYNKRHRESTKYTDSFKSSQLRYRSIPLEQDAWAMQNTAYEELNNVSDRYADEFLQENGMDSYSNIKKQSVAARWISRNLKEDTTPEDLITEVEKKVAQYFPDVASQIISIVSGKNKEAIIESVGDIEEKRKKADILLGLAA